MRIIILGPFTSGTNLTEKILNNFNLIRNETIFWKHNIDIDKLYKLCEMKDVVIIIMYRNMYNWINSIMNSKYDLRFNNIDDIVTFDKSKTKKYDNIIHLYNVYYMNYMEILKKYQNVVYLNYKKIIFDGGLLYIYKNLI